ncbi:MAG: hypothetical protein WBN16_11080, partial [Lutimonas sp.]
TSSFLGLEQENKTSEERSNKDLYNMACYLFPGKTIRRFDQKKQVKTGLKVVGNYSSKVVQIISKQKAFDSFFRQKK